MTHSDSTAKVLLTTEKFTVERISFEGRRGEGCTKDVIRHPGAVAVLPLLDGGRVCLIRNHRRAVDQSLIELPAGTLDPGESPAACARRELAEETGYEGGQLESLGWFYLSPGILDERMHLFAATALREGEPNRTPVEEIENLVVDFDDALRMIDEGTIHDAKTIVGLLRWQRKERAGESPAEPNVR